MNLKEMGTRIKQQREKRRLRQVDIAGALQITSQAVSKWERGENAPDISVLIGLSRLLGVSVEWLLGGSIAETDTFEATVFCTSLKGFAARAATMPPRDVAIWANSIYYTVTESLMQFGGVPIKYVGDGFLGFFTGGKQALRALKAARKARALHHASNLVIVLHKGDIFLGDLGHPDYASVDIIGQTVNSTFLVMPWVAQHCRNGIGITGALLDDLAANIDLTPCGKVSVMGMQTPIAIYEPQIESTQQGET